MKILDVGQCGIDGPRIGRLLQEKLGATVERASGLQDAQARMAADKFDVVLVNRVLASSGKSGMDVITELVKSGDTPVMLVSDRDDAQDAAVAAGAVRGFGKAALSEPATIDLIATAARARLSRARR